MLSFVQNFFGPRANPIGVDFGTDTLRLAQVCAEKNEVRLAAAGVADVPSHARVESPARHEFFIEAVRGLLAEGRFKGRRVVLSLPSSMLHVVHLRIPKIDEASVKKSLPFEIAGKIPFDPSQAILRHIIAGEIYADQDPKLEVIVLAAHKGSVDAYINAATKARLDIAGVCVEPLAMLDCFSRLYRRKADSTAVTGFIDIGFSSTRLVITQGWNIVFTRLIPIAGSQFTQAAAAAMQVPFDQAKLLRIQGSSGPFSTPAIAPLPGATPAVPAASEENSFALLGAAAPATVAAAAVPAVAADPTFARIDAAVSEPVGRLIEELQMCRRYYDATFPAKPLERLIFTGGEASNRGLCAQIARSMGLAAQLGDPIAKIARSSDVGPESGIDRRTAQPAWAVALGLTLGRTAVTSEV